MPAATSDFSIDIIFSNKSMIAEVSMCRSSFETTFGIDFMKGIICGSQQDIDHLNSTSGVFFSKNCSLTFVK